MRSTTRRRRPSGLPAKAAKVVAVPPWPGYQMMMKDWEATKDGQGDNAAV